MIVVAAKFSRGIKGTRYSRKNSVGLGAATSPCPRLPPSRAVPMGLSREEWLYGFEHLTPFFAAGPLKDA